MSDSFRIFRKLLSLRGAVYTLVLAMMVLVGIGVFIQSSLGNRLISRTVEQSIREVVPTMDLQIGQLNTLGWNGLELRNVSLSPVGEVPALSFQRLTIDWGVESGSPVRIFCTLEDPIVILSNNEAGELNWNRLFPPSETTEKAPFEWPNLGIDILIPTIEVRNGKLELFDQAIDWSLDMGVEWSRDNLLTWQLHDIDIGVEELGAVHSRSQIDGDGDLLNVDIGLTHAGGTVNILCSVESIVDEPLIDLVMDAQIFPAVNSLFTLNTELKETVVTKVEVTGDQKALSLAVGTNMGVALNTVLSLIDEKWDGEIQLREVAVEQWLTSIESTYLDGTLSFTGNGFDWMHGLDGTASVDLREPVIWKQSLRSLQTKMELHNGIIEIGTLNVVHPDAEVSLSGTADLHQSTARAEIESRVTSIQTWVPDFEAELVGQHTVTADWTSEEPVATVVGIAKVANVTDHGELFLRETQIESSAQWDGSALHARNQVSLNTGRAVGVFVPSMSSTVNLEVSSNGDVRIEGLPSIPEVSVGEGTLQLNRIQGYFEYVQTDTEPTLRTENMTVGEVVLVPAQYVIDGGGIDLSLVQDSLQAELHLIRKSRTFIHSKASAELNKGVWKVEQLDFSPTGDRSWELKDGISFELTEGGVGDLDLQLIGDAGDIRVKIDQYNDEPDIGVQVVSLDLGYIREVGNLFLGEDTIPIPMSGTMFGQVSLIGQQGRFEEGDYLLIKEFSSPELIDDVDLYVDLEGSIERLLTNIKIQDDTKVLAEMQLQIPTHDGAPSCLEPLFGEAILSESTLSDLNRSLPVIPSIDMMATGALYVQGTFCEPKIRFVGQGDVLVGAQGERMHWNVDMNHLANHLQGHIQVRDGVKSILQGSVHGRTGLSDLIEGNGEAGLFEFIEVDAQMDDLYLQRVGRLIGLPDLGKGPVKGDMTFRMTPQDWQFNSTLNFPKTRLAKHRLTENSGIVLAATPNGAEGTVLVDFAKKGALEGGFTYNLENDEIFATIDWTQVPATILSIFTPDITKEYGKIEGNLLVDGTLDDPMVNAIVSLHKVGFELPSLGVGYKDINMEASVENGLFSISKLEGEAKFIEQGPLDLANWGRFALDSTATYSDSVIQATARLGLDNFPVIKTDMAHATISGSITVLQDEEGTQFSGDAYVHHAGVRLSRDFFEAGASLALPENFHIHRNVDVVKESDAVDDWLDDWLSTVRGQIKVDLGDRVDTHTTLPMTNDYGTGISKLSEVRVDTILRGVLDVGWNRGEPTVLGTISTIRGSFVTMGKEFELGEGEVIFSGGDVYNPQLNLYAEKSFGEYGDIGVSVTGTVDVMELDFSATNSPYAYDQTDIVTLMLLGKPSQELANSESQTSGALIQAGLSSMGGAVGDVLSGSVVDNVDWDPTESMFRVGKTLSDTMFLSYMMNYGAEEGENINEVTLEWLLLQRVYGEFVTGDANNTEANVYYRWIF